MLLQPYTSFKRGKMVISLCRNGCTDRPSTWSTDCGRTLSPKAQPLVKNTYRTIILPCRRQTPRRQIEEPETHTKRQATQHGCLPSLLGGGNKEIEIVYGEEKIFSTGPTRAANAGQKSLVLE
jgi:hypothetical protein